MSESPCSGPKFILFSKLKKYTVSTATESTKNKNNLMRGGREMLLTSFENIKAKYTGPASLFILELKANLVIIHTIVTKAYIDHETNRYATHSNTCAYSHK